MRLHAGSDTAVFWVVVRGITKAAVGRQGVLIAREVEGVGLSLVGWVSVWIEEEEGVGKGSLRWGWRL